MTDIQLRIFAFCQAREVMGASASLSDVLASAEAIYRFVVESRGAFPTRH